MKCISMYSFLIIIFSVSNGEPATVPCNVNEDCNTKTLEKLLEKPCNFCSNQNDLNTKEAKCAYPFDAAIKVNENINECSFIKHCDEENACAETGTERYFEGLGICRCVCKPGYIGNQCERGK